MSSRIDTVSDRWHIRVRPRSADLDGHGRDVLADVRQIGLPHVEGVQSSKVYLLAGKLTESDVRLIAEELLTDAVANRYEYGRGFSHRADRGATIEVHTRPGVMNPVAVSTLGATRRLLRARARSEAAVHEVHVARRYEIVGAASTADLERIASKVLANACIEAWYIHGFGRQDPIPETFPTPPDRPAALRHVPIRSTSDDDLIRLSRDGHLFLSLEEMRAIGDYFRDLGRDPTDLELETLAQTWSEHCVHKTLRSAIDYRGDDFGRPGSVTVHFDNLFKDTIVAATTRLDRDWCLSVFTDNAGVIAFDEDYGIAFKAETHNHPSAIEPYGGAATGIGGCIRDIMGCGLGAKPIASTDVFCLAPPDFDPRRLPKDVLHPRRVLKGVVQGVRDYGNRMGIPTVNGAIYFDERYLANPLVFCGCVGLIPRDRIHKQANPGDHVVVAGGRTGRDGIHGATFSSSELTETHADEFAHAVQIGNAIEEKKLLDALLLARDHPDGCLYSTVTDCGAGGLSSAVGEMGAAIGAAVDLERVPLKYAGLRCDEIWISEAQERMVFAVPPDRLDVFLSVFGDEEVEATVIGTFTEDGILCVRYRGETVGKLEMKFLHEGRPQSVRTATWTAAASLAREPAVPQPSLNVVRAAGSIPTPDTFGSKTYRSTEGTPNDRLLAELSHPNTASKEWVIRQYDHEVQGRSVIKPLVGPGSGPSDAAVLRPRLDRYRGIALGCGLCPQLSDDDPYWMAVVAVDEALRNVICVGADPARIAILDNFCWPNVDTPESLGALVRACRGASDAAIAFGLPFISGKDSLNNEFSMSEEMAKRTGLPRRIAIPGTLLISALGLVHDVRRCVSMDLKHPGNSLVLGSAPVGPPAPESQVIERRSREPQASACADSVRPPLSPPAQGGEGGGSDSLDEAMAMHDHVSALIRTGKVRAAHDVSDGGLATTIAEMCIASNLGATVNVTGCGYRESLYTNTATTYVLEMTQADARESGLPVIGLIEQSPRLVIESDASGAIDLAVEVLAGAWRREW